MTEEIRLTLFVEIMALCSFVDNNVMEERFSLSSVPPSGWIHIPSKQWHFSTKIHGVIFQNKAIYLVSAVRASDSSFCIKQI
jgi:hypothetical protein